MYCNYVFVIRVVICVRQIGLIRRIHRRMSREEAVSGYPISVMAVDDLLAIHRRLEPDFECILERY